MSVSFCTAQAAYTWIIALRYLIVNQDAQQKEAAHPHNLLCLCLFSACVFLHKARHVAHRQCECDALRRLAHAHFLVDGVENIVLDGLFYDHHQDFLFGLERDAEKGRRLHNPVKQGMWGAFEVIFDTFVICTITSLVVVMSGMWMPGVGLDGAALSIAAFQASLGGVGAAGVTIGTVLFALSTLLGWSYYGEKSIEYLFKTKSWVGYVKLGYKVVFIVAAFIGSIGGLQLIWAIADTLNGLMAIPNLIALVLLSGTVTKLVKDYFKEEKAKKSAN